MIFATLTLSVWLFVFLLLLNASCFNRQNSIIDAVQSPRSDNYYFAIMFEDEYTIDTNYNTLSEWRLKKEIGFYDDNQVLSKAFNGNEWLLEVYSSSGTGVGNNKKVSLPVDDIKKCLKTQEQGLVKLYTKDTNGEISQLYTNTVDILLVEDAFTYLGDAFDNNHYHVQFFYPVFGGEIMAVTINYYDQGGVAFSGTHGSDYSTNHLNGEETQLDTPTKSGYIFDGWYLNDSSCSNESARVTSLSADTTYTTITLYAKWRLANCMLTLSCNNYGSQQYMICIYRGNDIYMQFVPTKATETITLQAAGDLPYKVCFVFGYFGNVTFVSLTNATAQGRNVTLNDFADASIIYTIVTPNINSSILI